MSSELRSALEIANVKAFLRVIRAGESSQDDDAYRMIVGGGLIDSFADHPRKLVWIESLKLNSTAAGAYQFLSRTWNGCAKALGLHDFLPASQDLAAVYLISGRGALADVLAGRIDAAIKKCALEWASLPGSPYGQPTRTMAQALATYAEWGGKMYSESPASHVEDSVPDLSQGADDRTRIKDDTTMPAGESPDWPPPEKPTMPLPAIIAALLPTIIEAIPKLGALFGGGSAVAERNVKAAALAVQIVQDATGAVNAQDAVERIKADPAVAAVAAQAIEARWLELAESGGGGISGARAFILAGDGNPHIWTIVKIVTFSALSFLFLANAIALAAWVVALITDKGTESATQFLSQVVTADIGATMTAIGFWLGSSWGSKQKNPP